MKVGLASIRGLGATRPRSGNYRGELQRLHEAFESASPAEHRRLLGLLGFEESEIEEFLGKLKESI